MFVWDKNDCSYTSERGVTYRAFELKVPNSDVTADVVAFFMDRFDVGDDILFVDYVYGATLMCPAEMERTIKDIADRFEREHEDLIDEYLKALSMCE